MPWPQGGFILQTPAFWGKNAAGTWTLRVEGVDANALTEASLNVHGSPWSEDSTYVYTDDLSKLAYFAPNRLVLDDPAGTNTINAAAISGAVEADLVAGTLTLGGEAVTIAPGTRVAKI